MKTLKFVYFGKTYVCGHKFTISGFTTAVDVNDLCITYNNQLVTKTNSIKKKY